MSNFNQQHLQIRNIPQPVTHTNRREIINFSSTTWTDTKGPNLDLSSSDWNLPNNRTAVLTTYSGSNNHTYTVTISDGSVHYLSEVSDEDYDLTYHLTDGGSVIQYVTFIEPTTLIFRDPNSNFILLNTNVRLFTDDDELIVQIYNGSNWINKFKVK